MNCKKIYQNQFVVDQEFPVAENAQFVSVHDLPVGETQDSPCGRISPLGQMSLGGKETQTSLGMLTHSGKQLEIIENKQGFYHY